MKNLRNYRLTKNIVSFLIISAMILGVFPVLPNANLIVLSANLPNPIDLNINEVEMITNLDNELSRTLTGIYYEQIGGPTIAGSIEESGKEIIVDGSVRINSNTEVSYSANINLTKETFNYSSSYSIKAYSLDNGKTWKKPKNNTFSNDTLKNGTTQFSKQILSKIDKKNGMTLLLSDKELIKKQPMEGATIIEFPKINAQSKPKLKRNDKLYDGEWVVTKNGNKDKNPIKENLEVGKLSAKKLDENGYGVFPVTGGITVHGKDDFFVRYAPTKNNSTYTAASPPLKIKVGRPKSNITTVKTTWWGIRIYISNKDFESIDKEITAKSAGKVVEGLLANLLVKAGIAPAAVASSPIVIAIAAAIVAQGVLLTTINKTGGKKGIILNMLWTTGPAVIVPTHQ